MAAIQNQYEPNVMFHPGETLLEKLSELGMGPKEFSVRSNKPEKTIIAILKGESSITPDMAVQFEHVLNIPAHFWLKLQSDYNEYIARVESMSVVENSVEWAKLFPVTEMINMGWIRNCTTWREKTVELFSFFGVSNPTAWKDYYLNQKLKVAFRISLNQTRQPYAISAWLRHGEIGAEKLNSVQYSEQKLKKFLPQIKEIMVTKEDGFFIELQRLCQTAGVKIVFSPCLPKAPILASTRWVGSNPVIHLSGSFERNDIFWFTFFHEIGHILLHGKKDVFLEGGVYAKNSNEILQKETEADDFAVKTIFSVVEERVFLHDNRLSEDNVKEFANKIHTHPAIIAGRLLHKRLVDKSFCNVFFRPIELSKSNN